MAQLKDEARLRTLLPKSIVNQLELEVLRLLGFECELLTDAVTGTSYYHFRCNRDVLPLEQDYGAPLVMFDDPGAYLALIHEAYPSGDWRPAWVDAFEADLEHHLNIYGDELYINDFFQEIATRELVLRAILNKPGASAESIIVDGVYTGKRETKTYRTEILPESVVWYEGPRIVPLAGA